MNEPAANARTSCFSGPGIIRLFEELEDDLFREAPDVMVAGGGDPHSGLASRIPRHGVPQMIAEAERHLGTCSFEAQPDAVQVSGIGLPSANSGATSRPNHR